METGLVKQDLDTPLQNNSKPLVAVYMVAYNCENYIAQAIEGVMMQETSFNYTLFIGDDCSTDSTAAICKKFQQRYPDKIELLLHPVNKGAVMNAKDVYAACFASGAAYVAMCEGDDYWTDKTKLQQQVDILEADDDSSLCFHNANILFEDTGQTVVYRQYDKEIYTLEDTLELGAFIPTASIVFRTGKFSFPAWYFRTNQGDYSLMLANALVGRFRLINKTMAVYRKHAQGMSLQLETGQDQMIYDYLDLLSHFNADTAYRYNSVVREAGIKRLYLARTVVNYVNTSDKRSLYAKVFSKSFWKRKLAATLFPAG